MSDDNYKILKVLELPDDFDISEEDFDHDDDIELRTKYLITAKNDLLYGAAEELMSNEMELSERQLKLNNVVSQYHSFECLLNSNGYNSMFYVNKFLTKDDSPLEE